MELKELHAEFQKVFKEFKEAVDRQDAEIKKTGEAAGETKGLIDKLNTRLDQLEVEVKRVTETKPGGGEEQEKTEAAEKKAAFLKWCRAGLEGTEGQKGLSPEERKKLILSDDTTGGFLAPIEYVRDILKGIIEFSPIRSVARVRTTSQRSIQHPKRTGTFAAQWVGEQQTRTETTGLKYGLEEIPNHELYALVDISFQDLEDSSFDLEAELRSEIAEQFGVAEGKAFVDGNAVNKPEGLLSNGEIAEVVSGNANLITADSLFDLYYKPKTAYAQSSTWVMNRQTIREVRKLKDAENRYLWEPSLQTGGPSMLLGRPVLETVDMPDIAANAYPVIFGDFRRGYIVVDRLQMTVIRDPLTQAPAGAVRFIARKRVGGQVVISEALAKLKIST